MMFYVETNSREKGVREDSYSHFIGVIQEVIKSHFFERIRLFDVLSNDWLKKLFGSDVDIAL